MLFRSVAVAANFAEVAQDLADRFGLESKHEIQLSVGSTGKLYAQIVNGAPFHALLAADDWRPRRLVERGAAVDGSQFTYALGRLALWSRQSEPNAPSVRDQLEGSELRAVAIANPKLAPYGLAAQRALEGLGLWESLRTRIVRAENVGQAFAMVASGSAELGFVALSSVLSERNEIGRAHV